MTAFASRPIGESAATSAVELVNEWDRFVTRVQAPAANVIWRFPLETASQSEGGFERTYQASILVPVWRDVTLSEGKPFEARVVIELASL